MNKTIFSILITVFLGQTIGFVKGENITIQEQNKEQKCSPIIEGLQFCTTSSKISVEAGNDIIIKVTLQNMSDKIIQATNGNLNFSYSVSITDLKGKKVLSLQEKIDKKEGDKLTLEQMIERLPIGTPLIYLLNPKQILGAHLYLHQFYKLDKGQYLLKLIRKVPKENIKNTIELPLDPVELEIK